MLLPRRAESMQNGIVTLLRKILGYVQSVLKTLLITMHFLQSIFVEVFKLIESQRECVINVDAKQLPKRVRLLLITIIYGIDILK